MQCKNYMAIQDRLSGLDMGWKQALEWHVVGMGLGVVISS